jgi:hypothetical protein
MVGAPVPYVKMSSIHDTPSRYIHVITYLKAKSLFITIAGIRGFGKRRFK